MSAIRSSVLLAFLLACSPGSTEAGRPPIRLPGHVLAALDQATPVASDPAQAAAEDRATPLVLTFVLKRDRPADFERHLRDVYDPQSPTYRRYLTQRELADRFGPGRATYDALVGFLRARGFTLVEGSDNRLTVTVRGSRALVERTLDVDLRDYRLGDRIFYANDRDPALPAEIAPSVQSVAGLSNLAKPGGNIIGYIRKFTATTYCTIFTLIAQKAVEAANSGATDQALIRKNFVECCQKAYVDNLVPANMAEPPPFFLSGAPGGSQGSNGLAPALAGARAPTSWGAVDGSGQTVGLVAFDSFRADDVRDFLALAGYPESYNDRVSQVHVNGGASLGPDQTEVLLDILAVLTNAPGANVVVYDAPFTGNSTSYQMIFNRMINDGVTIISNSWSYCEDQTTLADVQAIDAILANAAASGISVFNASGDTGSTCLDGSPNTVGVPASSPHATAVGGTSPTIGPALTYGSETPWCGSNDVPPSGLGGFGVSRFFGRPSYQDGFHGSSMRSIPDVVLGADPATGVLLCQADAGGCPTDSYYGGTSVAAPMWAAFTALLNQAQGQNLGLLNPALYALGDTDAFHSAASMGSDFRQLGLGSPNLNAIHRALADQAVGTVSGAASLVSVEPPIVDADGASAGFVVVRLRDADGHTVSGKTVTLAANAGAHAAITPPSGISNAANGAVVFSVTNTVPETAVFTATDTTDGIVVQQTASILFVSPPAASGSISAVPTSVDANGTDVTTITVTLQDKDGNPSPGKRVGLSQGNGGSIITSATGTTDATGTVEFEATNDKTETVTYTAVDLTDGDLPIPGEATVSFVNGLVCNQLGTAAPGYAVTTFVSGFPNPGCNTIGPVGLVFDGQRNLFVGGWSNHSLYEFGPHGGAAVPANQLNAGFEAEVGGLVFTPDGRLYAAVWNGNEVVEVDPISGAVLRKVADGTVNHPVGIAVDPLSGDLFVTQSFDSSVVRLSNFANGPATVTPYANISSMFSGGVDGIVFARDGTMYLPVAGSFHTNGIYRVSGTDQPQPATVTLIAQLPAPDGIALQENPADPTKPVLFTNRNDGIITRIDTSALPVTPTDPCGTPCTDIYAADTRGDHLTVGPDGCLYAAQSDRVVKLTNADGTCDATPTNRAPQIVLTPSTVSPAPAQGSEVTFTAELRNVRDPEDVPVTLLVTGANARPLLVRTDASGTAVFTYTGSSPGRDDVFASAALGDTTLFSNAARVTWAAGTHRTFLTLNASPRGARPGQTTTVRASLTDQSTDPLAPVAGQVIEFTLGTAQCSGTTDAAGNASCVLPVGDAKMTTLTAAFAGTDAFGAAVDSIGFRIEGPPFLGPFVTYALKPSKGSAKFAPFGPVTLADDAFAVTTAFDVSKPVWLGAPADEDGGGVSDPATHLAAYAVKRAKGSAKFTKRPDVFVTNQCGPLALAATKPVALLLPAARDFASPIAAPAVDDHVVDHFLCYAAKVQKKRSDGTAVAPFPKGVQVDASDEIDQSQPRRYDLKKPKLLCHPVGKSGTPVTKQGAAVPITPATVRNPATRLVCYEAKLATKTVTQNGCGPASPGAKGVPIVPKQAKHAARLGIHLGDQFGALRVNTKKSALVCIPSTATEP